MTNKKNILLFPFVILLAACLLTACGKRGPHEALFQEVETIVNERPDSALALLETIERPETLPEREWARYALLSTEAHDKNYDLHSSDSTINQVVAYYDKNGNSHQKARAYYYKGRVYNDMGNLKEALDAYSFAEHHVERTSDYRLMYLIFSQMGTIYAYQEMIPETFDAYKRAAKAAELAHDSIAMSFSQSYLARAYSLSNDWDLADRHYRHSIALAEKAGHFYALRSAIQELASIYVDQGRFKEALALARQLENFNIGHIDPHDLSVYYVIGKIYMACDQKDSAYIYLKRALGSDNIYTRSGTYELLSDLFYAEGKMEEGRQYKDMYVKAARDSINEMGSAPELYQIIGSHNATQEKENQLETGILFFIVVVFVICVFSFLLRKERRATRECNRSLASSEKDKRELKDQLGIERSQNAAMQEEMARQIKEIKEKDNANKTLTQKLEKAETRANESQQNEKLAKSHEKQYKVLLQQATNDMTEKQKEIDRLKADQIKKNLSLKSLLKDLHQNLRPLTQAEREFIPAQMEQTEPSFMATIYKAFENRIDKKVKEEGVILPCCLIRLGFSDTASLKVLLKSTSESALNKQMQRIRKDCFWEADLENFSSLVHYLQNIK